MKKDMKYYLTSTRNKFLRFLRLTTKVFFLPMIIIYPINRCNYRCKMCKYVNITNLEKKQVLSLDSMKKLLNELPKFLFLKARVHFSGDGEPLIYPHIVETMKYCKEKKIKWSMTTNGYLLEKYAKDIVDNECYALNVSIHGNKKLNDEITQIKNSYDKTIEGIKALDDYKKKHNKSRPVVAINCVITNDNVDQMKEILNNLKELPINSLTFQNLIFTKVDAINKAEFIVTDKKKLKKLSEFIEYTKKLDLKINFYPYIKPKDIERYYTNINTEFNKGCVFPWLTVKVFPNGDVGICHNVFGNINEEKLTKIINNKKARKFRKNVKKHFFIGAYCDRCCHRWYY